MLAPDNGLVTDGAAAALAGAVSKLVNLMSLNLASTWNVEWAASCVFLCVCVAVCVCACGVVIAVVVGVA